MELMLKNVQKKHLRLISELAKTLKIEVAGPVEDDAHYLTAMQEGEKSSVLTEQEKQEFISSLKGK